MLFGKELRRVRNIIHYLGTRWNAGSGGKNAER
jgi:hypothetical protein